MDDSADANLRSQEPMTESVAPPDVEAASLAPAPDGVFEALIGKLVVVLALWRGH